MMKILKGFALALSMLTTLPFFKVHDFFKGINGYAVMFYPLVGLILGLILWGVATLLSGHVAQSHLGIILFALLVLLSGALHLDGLADSVDGFFVPKERALEVMKDSHVGGMGMLFGATFLILKASSFAAFEAYYLLPVVLMLSRFNAVIAIYFLPYLSKNGIGTLAKEEFSKAQFFIASLYVGVIALFFSFTLLVASLFLFVFIQRFFMRRYGGFSGDMYGFMIEVSEVVLLNITLFGVLG